ncbi:hypothetical protein J6W91_02450 [Candidatus Saccharibacteria bacterium]|nr:hypothetical protein [Candidatus Saccharibacteria bacterium]
MKKILSLILLACSFALFNFTPVSALEIPVEVNIIDPAASSETTETTENNPVVPDTSGTVKAEETEGGAVRSNLLIAAALIALCGVAYAVFMKRYVKRNRVLKAKFKMSSIFPLIFTFLFVTVATAAAFIPVLHKKSHADSNELELLVSGDFKFEIEKGKTETLSKTVVISLKDDNYTKYKFNISSKTNEVDLISGENKIDNETIDVKLDETENLLLPGISNPLTVKNTGESIELTLTIGINDTIPAGKYVNTIVATADMVPTIAEVQNMQDMTAEACVETDMGVTTTLKDVRDDNVYSVAKLKDGQCWMTQNLRIAGIEISSEDSDMQDGQTFMIENATMENFQVNEYSLYRPDVDTSKAYVDNAEGGYGGYYNFYTATAGTGGESAPYTSASSSICPKGWRMPARGDFGTLANYYGPTRMVEDEPKFNLSGDVCSGGLWLKETAGWYWAKEIYDNDDAYRLILNIDNVNLGDSTDKSYGLSVRCIAR